MFTSRLFRPGWRGSYGGTTHRWRSFDDKNWDQKLPQPEWIKNDNLHVFKICYVTYVSLRFLKSSVVSFFKPKFVCGLQTIFLPHGKKIGTALLSGLSGLKTCRDVPCSGLPILEDDFDTRFNEMTWTQWDHGTKQIQWVSNMFYKWKWPSNNFKSRGNVQKSKHFGMAKSLGISDFTGQCDQKCSCNDVKQWKDEAEQSGYLQNPWLPGYWTCCSAFFNLEAQLTCFGDSSHQIWTFSFEFESWLSNPFCYALQIFTKHLGRNWKPTSKQLTLWVSDQNLMKSIIMW